MLFHFSLKPFINTERQLNFYTAKSITILIELFVLNVHVVMCYKCPAGDLSTGEKCSLPPEIEEALGTYAALDKTGLQILQGTYPKPLQPRLFPLY